MESMEQETMEQEGMEQENTERGLAPAVPESVAVPESMEAPRTLATIGAEIREHAARLEYHKRGTLWEAVEIGRRLMEARDQVDHGEWANFLARETGYTPRLASNFMRVFEGYKDHQTELFENEPEANRNTYSDLSYSKALALLALPEEEREKFVEENDVEDMTVRELRRVLDLERNARKEARAQNEVLVRELKETLTQRDEARAEVESERKRADWAERDKRDAIHALASRNEELRELRKKPVDVAVQKVVDQDAIDAALEEERDKVREAEQKSKELRSRLRDANDELERLRAARNEALKRENQDSVEDVAAFGAIYEQAQANINRLNGYIKRVRARGNMGLARKLENALTALSNAIVDILDGDDTSEDEATA